MNIDQRIDQIARICAELFDQRGYHGSCVDAIAAAAGLSKPTLYHYFGSKAEIVAVIQEDVVDALLECLETNIMNRADPRDAVRDLIKCVFDLVDTKPGYLRVFHENERDLPESEREEMRRKRHRFEQLLQVQIEEGMSRGVFRRMDSRLTTLLLIGMINWSYHWYRSDGPFTAAQIAQFAEDLFFHGVAQPE